MLNTYGSIYLDTNDSSVHYEEFNKRLDGKCALTFNRIIR